MSRVTVVMVSNFLQILRAEWELFLPVGKIIASCLWWWFFAIVLNIVFFLVLIAAVH